MSVDDALRHAVAIIAKLYVDPGPPFQLVVYRCFHSNPYATPLSHGVSVSLYSDDESF